MQCESLAAAQHMVPGKRARAAVTKVRDSDKVRQNLMEG